MSVLFFSFVALVIFHFVYEAIIAPSLRMELRLELHRVRDELRRLKIERDEELPDQTFVHVQNSINNKIRYLHGFNLETVCNVLHELEVNDALRRRVEQRLHMIEQCPSDELHRIVSEERDALKLAMLVNAGGWVVYVVPVVGLYLCLSRLRAAVRSLVMLPESDLKRVLPPDVSVPA